MEDTGADPRLRVNRHSPPRPGGRFVPNLREFVPTRPRFIPYHWANSRSFPSLAPCSCHSLDVTWFPPCEGLSKLFSQIEGRARPDRSGGDGVAAD